MEKKPLNAIRLQTKILFFFTLTVSGALIALTGIGYTQWKKSNADILSLEMVNAMRQVEFNVQSQIETARNNLELLSASDKLRKYLLIEDPNARAYIYSYAINQLFRRYVEVNPNFTGIYLAQPDGYLEVFYEHKESAFNARNFSQWWQPVTGEKNQSLQQLIVSPETKQVSLIFYKALAMNHLATEDVFLSPPSVRGVIIVMVNLNFLEEMVQSNRIRETGFIYFTDPGGFVLFHPDAETRQTKIEGDWWRQPSEGPILHEEAFYYSRPVSEGLWGIATLPRTEFLKDLNQSLVWISLMIGVTLLLLPIVYFCLIRREVIRPINQLIASMAMVTETGRLVPVHIQSNPELCELADHFNTMVQRLENNLHELRKAYLQQNEIIENEKGRIASDFHDQLGQLISHAKHRVESKAPYYQCYQAIEEIHKSMREIVHYLYPIDVKEHSLGVALSLSRLTEKMGRMFGMEISAEIYEIRRLPEEVELAIYRIAQESLMNALKHAEAEEIKVQLFEQNTLVTLNISDSGRGFESKLINRSQHHGHQFMHMRAKSVNGQIHIMSHVGRGTQVIFTVKRAS